VIGIMAEDAETRRTRKLAHLRLRFNIDREKEKARLLKWSSILTGSEVVDGQHRRFAPRFPELFVLVATLALLAILHAFRIAFTGEEQLQIAQ